MEKKQTAVEWLEEKFNNPNIPTNTFSQVLFNQAKEMEKIQNNNIKLPTIDSLPPSELIALKKYYDEKLEGAYKCRSKEQIEAEIISNNIEKRLSDICKIF